MKISEHGLSASAIKMYLHCPFQFFLTYVMKIRKPAGFAAENGTIIHATLEAYSLGKKKNYPVEMFHRYRKAKPWKLLREFLTHKKDCPGCMFLENIDFYHGDFYNEPINRDIFGKVCPLFYLWEGKELFEGVLARESNPFDEKIIAAELPFKVPLKGVTLNGFIDMVTEVDKDTIRIRDWKTGQWLPTYKECVDDPQLRIYDLVASILFPQYKYRILTFDYIRHKEYSFLISDEERAKNKIWLEKLAMEIMENCDPKRNLTYKCKSFCLPEVCDKEWPNKLLTIGKLVEEEKW